MLWKLIRIIAVMISLLVMSSFVFAEEGKENATEKICSTWNREDVDVKAECAETVVTVSSYSSSQIKLSKTGLSRETATSGIVLQQTEPELVKPVLFDRFSRFLELCQKDELFAQSEVHRLASSFNENCRSHSFEAEVFSQSIYIPNLLIN